MQKRLLIILFVLTAYTVFCQDVSELEKRGGFKDIKLGMIADSVKGVKLKKEFKEKDEFPAKLFTVEHPDYEKIGEVKVTKIELKAYRDLIYEISVVTDKDQRVMKALETLYGKADYAIKTEEYFWRTGDIVLKFKAHGKHHLELVYTTQAGHRMMKEDKNQKVDDIANDF